MNEFTLTASDGIGVACYAWSQAAPKAVVQIAHGMGEHAQRYHRLAGALNAAGYAVYANDHRGHGKTSPDALGDMGPDGWNRVLADAYELNRHIAGNHPGIPNILLGHSMGAMLAQQYVTRYGASIDALALSGSPGLRETSKTWLPRLIARFEAWRLGPEQASDVLQKLLFGGANKPFDGPQANGFEWLSRDPQEVQKYIDDPACGFVISAGSLCDMYAGIGTVQDPRALARIPKSLPVYIFSGSDDPVHAEQRGLMRLIDAYRQAGLTSVEYKVYPDGRHELFNETNRDAVTRDLIVWLNQASAAASPARAV